MRVMFDVAVSGESARLVPTAPADRLERFDELLHSSSACRPVEVKAGQMRSIGVLGGLGPQATMDFEVRLHRVAQELIPQDANSGYPPLVVLYVRHAPILLAEDHQPILPLRPDHRLLEAAHTLGQLVDFMVIPSNTPHLFCRDLEEAARCPVLSMIDLSLAELSRRGWTRVGVLGLGDPSVYTSPLDEAHVAYETIDGSLRDRLDQALFAVMTGDQDEDGRAVAREALDLLRAREVEGVILGCTELPLLLGDDADSADLIDPAQLLAEAAVRKAIE